METGRGKYIHLNITWKNRGPEHDTTVRNQCIRTENTAREHTFRSVVRFNSRLNQIELSKDMSDIHASIRRR